MNECLKDRNHFVPTRFFRKFAIIKIKDNLYFSSE